MRRWRPSSRPQYRRAVLELKGAENRGSNVAVRAQIARNDTPPLCRMDAELDGNDGKTGVTRNRPVINRAVPHQGPKL